MIYYRKELNNFLSVLEKFHENIIWLKLSKELLKTSMNFYIAGVYKSPKNSSDAKHNECNIIDTLRDQLSKFSPNDMVYVGDNFNSRIGTQNDFIIENGKDLTYLLQEYELDAITSVRNNQDTSVNQYGQQLLDLCIETKLRILNGRTRGDLQGYLTHVGFHGCSTVDLVLTSEAFLIKSTIVQYLSVQDLNFLSDHRPILLKLTRNCNFLPNKIIKDTQVCELKHKPTRYTWKN